MASQFLNQSILSHLLVAVPPAVILGIMVMDINDEALRLEAQRVHLAVASDLRDSIEDRIEVTANSLAQAERTLDLDEIPIDARLRLLRAMVASQSLPYVLIYRPDGKLDTVIGGDEAPDLKSPPLSEAIKERALKHAYALDPDQRLMARAWGQGDRLLGFVASELDLAKLEAQATTMADTYLGARGELDVIDRHGHYVMSARRHKQGDAIGPQSMFHGVNVSGEGGITSLTVGLSTEYEDANGAPQLASIVSSPSADWLVGTSRPTSDALASLRKVRLRVVLTALIAALLAGLAGLLIARQVSGPVHQLVNAVRRSARRGFDPNTKIQAPGELGELAEAFNGAVLELQEHRIELQRTTQIRMRMARLTNANTLHELMVSIDSDMQAPTEEKMVVVWADVHRDLEGSTQDLPTENLVAMLGEFFSAAHEAVIDSGGMVDRYAGDAVVGIFEGEDQVMIRAALKAGAEIVRAAQAITERWSESAHLHLNASSVVVAGEAHLSRSTRETGEITAYGPVLERASILFNSAPAGQVLVDHTVRQSGVEGFAFKEHRGTMEPSYVADLKPEPEPDPEADLEDA